MQTFSLLLLLLLLLSTSGISTLPAHSTSPDRFFRPSPSLSSLSSSSRKGQEYLELSHPLPADHLTPSCTLPIIHHSFANTINRPPFSTPYSLPPTRTCRPPWSHITLEFRASCKGDQYDRISGLWLGGVELLRTSTAEPTKKGIFWKVRKDITKYSSLLAKKEVNFTIMLENVVNNIFTGVYYVDVTIFFYKDQAVTSPFAANNHMRILSQQYEREEEEGAAVAAAAAAVKSKSGMYLSPADLIIPISSDDGYRKGYWYVIERESDSHVKKVRFPPNTRNAVLELYVSFHGNDEFWYSNPPDSYIRMNNLATSRGNGAYREVFVSIDGKIAGSVVPFPVVFTGGINPLFWEPVVAIGAFSLPSYEFDLAPFLGMVLDGKEHVFSIGVSDGISYWLVDANLHLWLDGEASRVEAGSAVYDNPDSIMDRKEEFRMLDGTFEIKGERDMRMEGWIRSSSGNLTTKVVQQLKFKSLVSFRRNGTFKYVKHRVGSKREVRVMNELGSLISRLTVKRRYPLKVITRTLPGSRNDTYMLLTNVSHAVVERHHNGPSWSSVSNWQVSNGWMEVQDHDVLRGEAVTNQTFRYGDKFGCYIHTVAAINGKLVADDSTNICPSVS